MNRQTEVKLATRVDTRVDVDKRYEQIDRQTEVKLATRVDTRVDADRDMDSQIDKQKKSWPLGLILELMLTEVGTDKQTEVKLAARVDTRVDVDRGMNR